MLQRPTLDGPFYGGATAPPTSGRGAIKPSTEPFPFNGLRCTWGSIPLKLFCFTLQVEFVSSYDTYRYDNRCHLLLPGPLLSIFFSAFLSCYKMCLSILLGSDDVESNPGLNTQVLLDAEYYPGPGTQILERILVGQNQIAEDVTLLKVDTRH